MLAQARLEMFAQNLALIITAVVLLSMAFVLLVLVWTLVETLLAAWVGAWLYREVDAGASGA